ncbi:MAG TPA: hypothetical protein PLI09_09720 [Candidatus Hydrogenedentes bacterium]|nr:hypothetical protein [Candidatus Hydrogenedentota bacterium]
MQNEGTGAHRIALVVDTTSNRTAGYPVEDYPASAAEVVNQAFMSTNLCAEVKNYTSLGQAYEQNKLRLAAGKPGFDYYIIMKLTKTYFRAGAHPAMAGPQFILFPLLEPFVFFPIHFRFAVGEINWQFVAQDKQGLLLTEKSERWRKKRTFVKNCYYSNRCMSWAMDTLLDRLALYMYEESEIFLKQTMALNSNPGSSSVAPNEITPPTPPDTNTPLTQPETNAPLTQPETTPVSPPPDPNSPWISFRSNPSGARIDFSYTPQSEDSNGFAPWAKDPAMDGVNIPYTPFRVNFNIAAVRGSIGNQWCFRAVWPDTNQRSRVVFLGELEMNRDFVFSPK